MAGLFLKPIRARRGIPAAVPRQRRQAADFTDGPLYPEWVRNGRELFFRANDNRIMLAAYAVKGDSFVADKPPVWSQKQLADPGVAGKRRGRAACG